jgi:multiple sugar transport system permease protein
MSAVTGSRGRGGGGRAQRGPRHWRVTGVVFAPAEFLVVASLQPGLNMSQGNITLGDSNMNAYRDMWSAVDFTHYLVNSLVITSVAALCATAFAATAGYALARFRFRGYRPFELTVIGTQLVPGSMFLLPLFVGFIWLRQNTFLDLYDSRVGMILVYTAFFAPVAIFLMRSFFLAVPPDLEHAAMVDGCSRFGAFVRVVLPTAAPGVMATYVYAFLFAWDELLFASALTREDAPTIPVGIRQFMGPYSEQYSQLMAAGVVSTLPILVAFFATQRWLVKGLTAGAVKG